MNADQLEYVRAWLSKATSDLHNAQLILAADDPTPPLDTVCFHCQQAAEKYLKAYLAYHSQSFPFTHNLADIVDSCIRLDPDFSSILIKAETLTPYAVEIRYPDDFYMPSRSEADESLTIATEIRDFVLSRMTLDDCR